MTTLRESGEPAKERSVLYSVAWPKEHGGWGLTFEPALLGMVIAPGVAGLCLALAALVAFMVRTPLRFVLVDHYRGRSLERTKVARRLVGGEATVLAALMSTAITQSQGEFWLPALIAGPFIITAFWFEMRSRSRRLIPELAGAVGVSSVAAMVVLADGGNSWLAAGTWLILAARAVTSIPHVRDSIARLHGRPRKIALGLVADAVAVVTAIVAVSLHHDLMAGGGAVVAVVAIQRIAGRALVPRPAILGMRQMAMGLGVVAVTAIGVLVSTK